MSKEPNDYDSVEEISWGDRITDNEWVRDCAYECGR